MADFPYLPLGREIVFVPSDNQYLQAAKKSAEIFSTNPNHPTGAVIVKNSEILGQGGNASRFHSQFGCLRKLFRAPTGKFYRLCPGCNPRTHAEAQAIRDAKKNSAEKITGADLYLWGHWWCCQHCWDKMITAGIRNVYLDENAEKMFRK